MPKHNKRDAIGRYRALAVCEWCHKSAPADSQSDDETCNEYGLGLTLCARKRCVSDREQYDVASRVERYRYRPDLV